MSSKEFKYGDVVRVKLPRERAFTGKVYSQYRPRGPRSHLLICIEKSNGCGVAYPIRYVDHARQPARRGARKR